MTHEEHPVVETQGQYRVILANSITSVVGTHSSDVLVDGSHCGINVAGYAIVAGLAGMIGNDTGRGLEDAGIAAIPYLDRYRIPAAAVDCMTAHIGVARTTYESGVISVVNETARELGLAVGMAAHEAARLVLHAAAAGRVHPCIALPGSDPVVDDIRSPAPAETSVVMEHNGTRVILIDSAGSFSPEHAGAIVIDGSHVGVNTGGMAVDAGVAARIGNDAGRGADDAGIRGLEVMQRAGIPGATVASRSAMIGIAASTWESGRISAANDLARERGVVAGMSVPEAAERLLLAVYPGR